MGMGWLSLLHYHMLTARFNPIRMDSCPNKGRIMIEATDTPKVDRIAPRGNERRSDGDRPTESQRHHLAG